MSEGNVTHVVKNLEESEEKETDALGGKKIIKYVAHGDSRLMPAETSHAVNEKSEPAIDCRQRAAGSHCDSNCSCS